MYPNKPSVLLIEEESANLIALHLELVKMGYRVARERSPYRVVERAQREDFEALIIVLQHPALLNLDIVSALRQRDVTTPVLIIGKRRSPVGLIPEKHRIQLRYEQFPLGPAKLKRALGSLIHTVQ